MSPLTVADTLQHTDGLAPSDLDTIIAAFGLDAALIEVRDDQIRQITDAKHHSEPRDNRFRRTTL